MVKSQNWTLSRHPSRENTPLLMPVQRMDVTWNSLCSSSSYTAVITMSGSQVSRPPPSSTRTRRGSSASEKRGGTQPILDSTELLLVKLMMAMSAGQTDGQVEGWLCSPPDTSGTEYVRLEVDLVVVDAGEVVVIDVVGVACQPEVPTLSEVSRLSLGVVCPSVVVSVDVVDRVISAVVDRYVVSVDTVVVSVSMGEVCGSFAVPVVVPVVVMSVV